jgi:pseudouridine synthase
MQERLQKIIARAGIASRRHAEQLILSGQVRVNGHVVRELGTKADPEKDRVEAAGRLIEQEERRVYMLLNKPPEVMSTLADPEGRKTLRNLLRGFPARVYPVGNLEYSASGLIFLTNDGDLAAALLKKWDQLEQIYFVKVKGMLTLADLDRLGKEASVRMRTLRQPDATRGRVANYWYEVTMRDSKLESLRRLLMKERHPIEKVKRVALGSLTSEGIPPGRYRILKPEQAAEVLEMKPAGGKLPSRHFAEDEGTKNKSAETKGEKSRNRESQSTYIRDADKRRANKQRSNRSGRNRGGR